ncbi:hypothetical protein ONZ45_g19589 [Pleurotus djamor]|nr:hypothetical protein ONZ45_g19589 [Pleurotus djamor]
MSSSSGPRIVIKPRAKASTPVPPTASSSKTRIIIPPLNQSKDRERSALATPNTESMDEDADEEGDEGENEDDEQPGGDGVKEETEDEPIEGDVPSPMAPRPRGRPRGRGRGGSLAGSGTPRARGRGRGRGRPRGRPRGSITIKLSRRQDEDGDASGGDSEVPQDNDTADGDEGDEASASLQKPSRKVGDQVYTIDGDEFVTPDNEVGDTKIDKNGNLLGGRKFKAGTFILPNRDPERMYMLAIDAARTSGFRDSLYYFRRNPLALKLNATHPEKEYLIKEGKLGSHLKTRSVTLITARSAFKLHGSKMIQDGKWVVDDYDETKALEEATARGAKAGDPVTEPADPRAEADTNTAAAKALAKADRERGGGGLGIYRAGGPTTIFGGSGLGPYSDGPLNAVRKSMLNRDGLTEENWMWQMAGRVLETNSEIEQIRRAALHTIGPDGIILTPVERRPSEGSIIEEPESELPPPAKRTKFHPSEHPRSSYEAHTATLLYRKDTQPTRARWEAMPESPDKPRVLGGTKVGGGAWAIAYVDTVMEPRRPDENEELRARRELMRSAKTT